MSTARRIVMPPPGLAPEPADLWGPFYGALWLNATLMAGVILLPRLAWPWAWLAWAIWAALLGAVAFVANEQRILIHDLLLTLNHRERLGLGVLAGVLFLMPAVFERFVVVPDGFLWATPLALLIAVTPSLARRLLALTIAGGWCAAYWARGPFDLALLLAFAISWLLALGMAHVTFVADAHEFTGRWPAARLVRSALATALPATAAGVFAWIVWPRGGLIRWTPPVRPAGDRPVRLIEQVSQMDLMELFWQWAVIALFNIVLIVLLYYLRRWFLRHRLTGPGELVAGRKARLEYAAEQPLRRRPALAGLRGRIVRLWGKWEAALGREGLVRRPGETADEFARRLAREQPEAAPPAALTELLDCAHYGPAEMDKADVARMRALVQDELSRQSLRRQTPTEDAVE